jgi:acetate kinase
LHEVARSNTDARLAIDMFCYSAGKQLAAMSAALGGVDVIIFTGGIGENDAEARALICGHLGVIGVRLDAARNRDAGDPISDVASRCQVRVLPSQEDEQIARQSVGPVPTGPGVLNNLSGNLPDIWVIGQSFWVRRRTDVRARSCRLKMAYYARW